MNIFETVRGKRIKRSHFNLSHEKKLSMNMGELVPILVQEAIPGDKFQINSETLVRFAPMVAPVMHRVNAYVHYFFVPNRLLWDYWEDFITGDQELSAPTWNTPNGWMTAGSIYDYLGMPTHLTTGALPMNTLPLRAYKLIYNEYYRDQDLQPEVDITADAAHAYLFKRAWQKDYFTSARPWAQKGGSVQLPTSTSANYADVGRLYDSLGVPVNNASDVRSDSEGYLQVDASAEDGNLRNLDEDQPIDALIDINDLRTAHRLQRWLEKNARAGSRYVEHLLAHFGVLSDDARLQRPEYLGGGKSPVIISEVVNQTGRTSDDTEALPQGSLAGHAINVGNTNQATKYCKEHGWIMGIMSVIPTTNYFQGIPRQLSRKVNTDYYFPEFAQLGEQEVLNQELYVQATSDDQEVFGYQARYAEYRHGISTVHGDFKDTLKFWHMAREFDSKPVLNYEFVEANPTERIFSVEDNSHKLWVNVYNNVQAARPIPKYNVPSL